MPVVLAPTVAIHQPASTAPSEDRDGPLVRRVRCEYLEMPGLCLTFDQACRLWALDSTTCGRVMRRLVGEGFIAVSDRGNYVRRTTA
jgi:hypothetical protein